MSPGIGTALLAAHHAALDGVGIPAYLEASSPRNRALHPATATATTARWPTCPPGRR